MFKNMKIGTKIILGFSSVLILLVVVGIIAYRSLDGASTGFGRYRETALRTNLMGRIDSNMLMMRLYVKDYLVTGSETGLKEYEIHKKKAEEFLARAKAEIKDPERAAKINSVEENVNDYGTGFAEVVKFTAKSHNDVNEVLNIKGVLMEKSLTEMMVSAHADGDMNASFYSGLAMRDLFLARLYMVKFLETNDQKSIDRVHEELGKMQEQLNILDKDLKNPKRRDLLAAVITAREVYAGTFDDLVRTLSDRNKVISGTLDRIGPEITKDIEEVNLSYKSVQDELGPQLTASNQQSITLILVIGSIAVILGVGLTFVITRGITKPLNLVIGGLREGAEQVTSASGQISASSQSLAEGASQQAASIEETSSSMEEMASMTKRNSESAGQADNLMKETNQVVKKANESMTQLTLSMEDISKASEETSKIIKTIDEIAFQTNLLALNAAVEAARAGEAGAGFAVVADEVRNLAMRAADAAKNTANLIEGTVKKVNDGSDLVAATNEAFGKVAESSAKVGNLVAEISEASKEQTSGIEQVNMAISEMDKVVQQNASNAEESASASEEMSAQAEQLMDYVGDLVKLVEGRKANGGNGANGRKKALAIKKRTSLAHFPSVAGASRTNKKLAYQGSEIRPDQVIPFDGDENFKDF
jgi:methyl-accepting chemotaxis protein